MSWQVSLGDGAPEWLPREPRIQRLLEGMIVSLTAAEGQQLDQLVVQALDTGNGVWISRQSDGPSITITRMGLSERIPTGQIWDISEIRDPENLRYYYT